MEHKRKWLALIILILALPIRLPFIILTSVGEISENVVEVIDSILIKIDEKVNKMIDRK